jgi:hypothetical protein
MMPDSSLWHFFRNVDVTVCIRVRILDNWLQWNADRITGLTDVNDMLHKYITYLLANQRYIIRQMQSYPIIHMLSTNYSSTRMSGLCRLMNTRLNTHFIRFCPWNCRPMARDSIKAPETRIAAQFIIDCRRRIRCALSTFCVWHYCNPVRSALTKQITSGTQEAQLSQWNRARGQTV